MRHLGRGERRRWASCSAFSIIKYGIAVFFTTGIILAVVPFYDKQNCDCDTGKSHAREVQPVDDIRQLEERMRRDYLLAGDNPTWGPHKLCLIVPFRDRFDELTEFVPHMHKYLNNKKVRHKILIINQVDSLRFNRASLINAGFLQAEPDCDYIAMHDVDLLPLNPKLNYSYPDRGPFHVAAPELHPKYHYPTFVGGILLLTNKQFRTCNGLSNVFWGWGREDDEFYVRMREAKLKIYRPVNITTGLDTFKHFHEATRRKRDYKRYANQKQMSRRRDRITGLDTVSFEIVNEQKLSIDNAPATLYNIELTCDLEATPYCVHPDQLDQMIAAAQKEQKAAEVEVKAAQNQMNAVQSKMNVAVKHMESAKKQIKPLGYQKANEEDIHAAEKGPVQADERLKFYEDLKKVDRSKVMQQAQHKQ